MISESQKLELIQMILALQDEELLNKIEGLLSKHPVKAKEDKPLRRFGFAKGLITYVAPDFDDTPPGFEDYMPEA
jgi:hypothetical protein